MDLEDDLPTNHTDVSPDVPIGEDASGNYGFILFKDYESDNESDDSDHLLNDLEEPNDSDLQDEDHQEIRNDVELLQFTAILAEVQKVAVKLEQQIQESKPNCPKHYTRTAPCTKRTHAQKRRTIAAEGQKSINQYFTASAKVPQPAPPSSQNVGPDSDDNEKFIVDIEEHLDQIFGGPEDVHMATPSESSGSDSEFYSVSRLLHHLVPEENINSNRLSPWTLTTMVPLSLT